MEQYEKNGPPPEMQPKTDKIEIRTHIQGLERKLAEQQQLIDLLQREIKRLKSRMDQLASSSNKRG